MYVQSSKTMHSYCLGCATPNPRSVKLKAGCWVSHMDFIEKKYLPVDVYMYFGKYNLPKSVLITIMNFVEGYKQCLIQKKNIIVHGYVTAGYI